MSKDNGGPAFPEVKSYAGSNIRTEPGMTLRDYFAAKAMQSIVIGNLADESAMGSGCAADAYRLADSMLAERSK